MGCIVYVTHVGEGVTKGNKGIELYFKFVLGIGWAMTFGYAAARQDDDDDEMATAITRLMYCLELMFGVYLCSDVYAFY